MATYKKKKISFKSIISLVLVIGAVIALGAGITSFAKDETKTVNKLGLFDVGSISETSGEYVKTTNTLYTNRALECQGLTITPDFDNKSKYQIFWYNEDDIYFGCTEVLTTKYVGNVPECARYCRIVVFPNPVDENGKEIKDFTIKFYEKQSYVKNLEIKVDKDQAWTPADYYEVSEKKAAPEGHTPSINDGFEYYEGYSAFYNWETSDFVTDIYSSEEHDLVIKLDCSTVKSYRVTLGEHDESVGVSYVLYDADGKGLGVGGFTKEHDGISVIVNVADILTDASQYDNAKYIVFTIEDVRRPIQINKYLPR